MRDIERRADAVREFNRFYTPRIGVLGDDHLGSDFSLTEARVLYELAHRKNPTASVIAGALGLDRGYLSRTLQSFKRRRLISTEKGPVDKRQTLLQLTAAGRRVFAPLEKRTRDAIVSMLEPLSLADQQRTIDAMRAIQATLGAVATSEEPFTLREHRPGDMGWVVYRHGVLYSQEWGYDETFEALVASVVAEFIQNFKPDRERCWIAERNGEIIGSIFVVEKAKTVAKLRLLLVEPTARGLGLGGRLVDEVIAFARQAGYKKIVLWTQSELVAARKVYQARGFKLVDEEKHHSFAKDLVAETWQLDLR